jgi:hypothetical protein
MTAETRAEIEWLGGRKSGDGELGDPPPPPKSPLNERGNRGDGRRRWLLFDGIQREATTPPREATTSQRDPTMVSACSGSHGQRVGPTKIIGEVEK